MAFIPLAILVLASCTNHPSRPNVVFIMADDQRWDMLSSNGNPYVETPHLDRLAREGCSFPNAFTVSGVCSPSRANFFSGKYSHNCGAPQIIWKNNTFLMNEKPFPALLQEAGYYSAHVGKWHLGEGQKQKPGYDYWAGFEWLGEFFDTKVHVNGEEMQYDGFSDDILAGIAAGKIREMAGREQPFCLFVGLKAPHLPFSYPERYEHLLDSIPVPEPASIDEDYDVSGRAPIMKSNVIRIRTFQGGIPMFGSWESYVKAYYRSSQALDDAVGIILDALDESGITDETIIIYSSDQGYTLGEHGMTEKHYAYEQVMRIPMLIRYPELVKAGSSPEALVLNIDLAPTVLDLCGIDPPEEMDGRSWKGIFTGNEEEWRKDFLFEYWDYRSILPSQLAVRSADFKLITYQDYPETELYDLRNDPRENRNVASDPEYAGALSEMQSRLERLVTEEAWKKRLRSNPPHCWVLGPVDREDAGALRSLAFDTSFDPSAAIDFNGKKYQWQKVETGKEGWMDFGGSREGDPGKVLLVSIPVKRLAEKDPHAILDMRPARETTAWYRGEKIWECDATASLGLSYYNFPLLNEDEVIQLELSCAGPQEIEFILYAPEGSIELL